MAGTEQAGFRAAIAELFTDARWVLCPPEAGGLERWLDVAALAISLGANIFPLSAGEHDRAMGLISGLPHLLALGLEAAVAHGPGYLPALTAGSFADLTRVAGSAPHLLRAVTESNKESVRVALHQLLDQLGGSWDALIDEGHRAHLSRAAAVGAGFPDATKPDTVAVPGAAELLAMGRSGRYVISLDIDRRTMTLSAAAES
jgi:prephenate dehydrogenase